MPTHIGLPDEYAAQIKRFAENGSMTMADAIGELIRIAVAAGEMPFEVPGFSVARKGDVLTLAAEGGYKRTFATLEIAKAFATALEFFGRKHRTQLFAEFAMPLSGAHLFGITKQGAAVKITDEDGHPRVLAPSVARDVAQLIRNSL